MAITLTDRAITEIKKIFTENKTSDKDTYLRLGVKGGGCSGFSYVLDMVDTKSDKDEEWEYDGVKVLCDSKSYLYLNGTELDFRDELMGRGFVFDNPNASHKCGCGSSFSA